MENEIKVSVIMPVYNSVKYLETAVMSILNQSLKEIELILVDDGSTDGSSELCDAFAQKDNRVRVIHQKNGGICSARNAGIKISRGEYIGFSDHDDEYGENQLADNYNLGKKKNADIVKYGSKRLLIRENKIIETQERKFKSGFLTPSDIEKNFFKLWIKEVLNGVWDAIFKASFLKSNNILFDSYYKYGGEDYDFCWQCIGKNANIYINDKVYYNHYLRTNFSTSAQYKDYSIKVSMERPKKLFSHVQSLNLDLNKHKKEYTYFWLKMSLGDVCHLLSHPNCNLTKKEKTNILKNLTKNDFFNTNFLNTSYSILKNTIPRKYILLLWLYQHNMYSSCLYLYKIQYIFRGICKNRQQN